MKIRTLDSMEEINSSPERAGVEGGDGDGEGEPKGIIMNRNFRETSEGGSNTAFTFGVPMGGVDKTVEEASGRDTPPALDNKKNGGSEVPVSHTHVV